MPKQPRADDRKEPDDNPSEYELRLFISGATPNSLKAIKNVKSICDKYIPGRYSLEIIDVYQQPAIGKEEQLIALPTLIKKRPFPERRMIGDLSDESKVLKGLGIKSNG